MKRALLILLSLLSFSVPSWGEESFSVPEGLENEVRFWRTVFGTYGEDQVIFHDEKHLNVIYEVIDFSGLNSRRTLSPAIKRETRQKEIIRTRERIAASLPSQDVARRIRVQQGQKDHLRRAIEKSTPWMGDIEGLFEENGLPKELTALMFIESMFNPRALSDVGASGVWQFMPETGRSYVSINDFWDNRNDTLHASAGAARFLKDLYRQTGDWALAINAYHSGLGRITQAVKRLGTKKIAVIVHDFKDPGYGFYSRNYVPEFLAIVGIYRNQAAYFGPLSEKDDRQYDIVRTSDFVILPKIASRFGIRLDVLKSLNTALKPEVLTGDLPLPPDYPLRVPKGIGYYLAATLGENSAIKTPPPPDP